MKILVCFALAACAVAPLFAQTAVESPPAVSTPASSADVQALRDEVRSLKELVQTLQQHVKSQQPAATTTAPDQPTLPEKAETPTAETAASPAPSASAPSLFPTTDSAVVSSSSSSSKVDANGTGTFPTTDESVTTTAPSSTTTTSETSSSLTQPIPILGGGNNKNYMNISFDSVSALATSSDRHLDQLEVGDHDPQQRGFNARNAEIAIDGAVDPYFEGFANIVLKLDNDNNTEIELEEAFLQTTTLPFGLQLKGGQFFDAFGRINATHPHTWEFADSPLVNGRLLGPDGLRGVGAQISWTLPTPWYAQLIFAVQNGRGGTAYSFRNPGDDGVFYDRPTIDRDASALHDMLYVPRLETSFNPSDTQTVLLGASGAFGMNDTGADNHTQIYGADFLYKWKSSRAEGGFPFVKWQTEAIYRRFEAGRGLDNLFPVDETFRDWGLYSQVLWGFKKGWVAGIRGDYLHMQESAYTEDETRQSRSRISVDLTWYPTEFSKLRLQYNHDFLEENDFLASREADSIFLQFEFILGAHGAHKF